MNDSTDVPVPRPLCEICSGRGEYKDSWHKGNSPFREKTVACEYCYGAGFTSMFTKVLSEFESF